MKRITISVPDDVAAKAQRAVESGDAENVSAYFVGLVQREPDWALARDAASTIASEAGGVSSELKAWARDVLDLESDVTPLAA